MTEKVNQNENSLTKISEVETILKTRPFNYLNHHLCPCIVFKLSYAISLTINCETEHNIDHLFTIYLVGQYKSYINYYVHNYDEI